MKIQSCDFGDKKDIPAIEGLTRIFESRENSGIPVRNQYKYCVSKICMFHTILNKYKSLNKKEQKYLYRLIKQDFFVGLDNSILTDKMNSFMKNILNAIQKNKLK